MNKKRIYIWLLMIVAVLTACKEKPKVLYDSEAFTLYSDGVVQGDFEARAVTSTHLVSTYRSTASEHFSRLVTFKFCINEKDVELPSGADHWMIIDRERETPIIQFGEAPEPMPEKPAGMLPANYKFTFRADMRPVLSAFKEKGYYEAFNGSRIAAEDFKAFQVAGGADPLTWDFSNLDENGLELMDPDGDGIYELTILLNPLDTITDTENRWMMSKNKAAKPHYESDQKIVDALFNLSVEEAILNIEPDSTLRTGAKWGGVWTRDVSYSTLLAFAYHEPEVARISLMKKVKNGRIIQDTGSGGAWPVSSDRTTWSLAAWEIYKVTGDRQWLQQAYQVIKNTLGDDYLTLKSAETGMFRGESSFLDWREQTYPKWMSNVDIAVSENLGTNAVHYRAHIILAEMAKLLGEPFDIFQHRANTIREGINKHLWMEEQGFYGQYLYGRTSMVRSPRFEALGESLCILFDVADNEQARSVIMNSPVTLFGTTCIYPQIPGIQPYHNNAIWPFVQSFWNLAAAKAGNEEALVHGLAAIYRPGALFLTNYENFVAENGDYVGTEINSGRMLWSIAGNLAMVHRLFMGMSFEVDGIRFSPVIPAAYTGKKELTNFSYRDAVLNISVKGHGNEIASIRANGAPLENNFLPASVSGNYHIEIVMKNNSFDGDGITLAPNRFSLPAPKVELEGNRLRWNNIPGAASYQVYRDGVLVLNTKATEYEVDGAGYGEYAVSVMDSLQWESFISKPLPVYPGTHELILESEDFVKRSGRNYSNFSGTGFVEVSQDENRRIAIPLDVRHAGTYRLDLRYSNGTGPWNTDNNCAIRSLYVNDQYKGVLVFPQRGTEEWSDWGFSNQVIVELQTGRNNLVISFEPWNTNMDGDINTAMIDYLRMIRID